MEENTTETTENITNFPVTATEATEAASAVSPELEQYVKDVADLQTIAQGFELAKVALQLKQITFAGQTERHALYDRVLAGAGTPLINLDCPAWNIVNKDEVPDAAK